MTYRSLDKATKTALFFYSLLWAMMVPLLRFHKKMKIGYQQRILKTPLPSVDLWIQAASVGEAYLVEEIIQTLVPCQDTTILVTTNTSQGFEILTRLRPKSPNISLVIRYCPFDQPKIIFQAIETTQPKLVLLIESELWPGLLSACKQHNIPVLVANGRMTEKSMNGYLRLSKIWQNISPEHILAISPDDAKRFQAVFGDTQVTVMFNIKFDRLLHSATQSTEESTLNDIIPEKSPFLVLGSIREEEEEVVEQILESLLYSSPDLIIGLFPRHMERVASWCKQLNQTKKTYQLRSKITQPVDQGTIILWDTIGELGTSYRRANTTFIGGSLADLGGQNFLEPLSAGVRPIIGPSWSNFHWVGDDIFQQNMVLKIENWQEAANTLLSELTTQEDKQKIQSDFRKYAQKRRGGVEKTCAEIIRYIS